MFDSLSSRLDGIAKRLRGKGRLTEADVDEVMREACNPYLEADRLNLAARLLQLRRRWLLTRSTERAQGHLHQFHVQKGEG